ncbi:hypothetical protein NDI54_05795 [Haloarcula sp. S1AR25-5A]|uniref:Uncharacterized protein n=1 Tax=Haloarcula terrestris TaxID=2950533 RepID=A0AAE4JI90_9EURY|nr:hypothetical protein [Haloarcula terrestris]MDS0220866.1 hypothetical protein [Haloarcula terrestris]
MTTADTDELRDHVEESLGDHRDLLELLADLDTDLSEDAQRALEILEDGGQS